ncbi:hypothetical protein RB597_003105 [Gaeumannomyces tritici]
MLASLPPPIISRPHGYDDDDDGMDLEVTTEERALEREIAELERRLDKARAARLHQPRRPDTPPASSNGDAASDFAAAPQQQQQQLAAPLPPATHFLLLLSDSALPLGAFAFSSGLESFLAHSRSRSSSGTKSSNGSNNQQQQQQHDAFASFLPASVSAFASSSLPFALAAHRAPHRLSRLDDALDATVVCAVGRRASVAQGRALLSVWERCFAPALQASPAYAAVASFAAAVRAAPPPPPPPSTTDDDDGDDPTRLLLLLPPAAHLAPLFGAVCRAAGLGAREAAAVLVVGHIKALVSAAVRAGVFGPYQAQRLLAGDRVRELVDAAVCREWDTPVELAGQTVPVMDLWLGRHELLYSRIFNS